MPQISVIIGPPGTGKTTEMSRWAARAAARYGHDRVLVCSLTRTGAKQAAREIELPMQQIGTVHAFAHRALGSPVLAESKIGEWNEAHPELALSCHSATDDSAYDVHDDLTETDRVKLEVARLRTFGLDPGASPSATVVEFHQKWHDWKRQLGYLDYTDLIATALREVDAAPGDPAVLINDEAQDTGLAEMRLLLRWAAHAEHLVLTGDSQQALFAWRGSNPLLLQELWQAHDAGRMPLQQSYRLSRGVYDYAYQWAGRFQATRRVAFVPRDIAGQIIHADVCFERLTPHEVADLVQTFDDGSESEYVPLMFLATCGYMLDPVVKALRAAGIPFFNPWRPNHGGWNPLPQRRTRGLTIVDRVLAFLRPLPDVWGDQARFWSATDLKAWAGGLPATGIFVRGGVQAIQALSDTATDTDLAKAFAAWFLPEARTWMVPHPDMHRYLAAVKGSDRLRDFVTQVVARHGAAKLRERPRVAVGTVHSTKGSEANTVFLCPDVSLQAWDSARQDDSVAEELRRVFYVGITRTRDRLVLCKAGGKTAVRW